MEDHINARFMMVDGGATVCESRPTLTPTAGPTPAPTPRDLEMPDFASLSVLIMASDLATSLVVSPPSPTTPATPATPPTSDPECSSARTRGPVQALPNLPLPRRSVGGSGSLHAAISNALKEMKFTGTLLLEPGEYTEAGPIHIECMPGRDLAIVGTAPGVRIRGKAGQADVLITGESGKGLLQNVTVGAVRIEATASKWFIKDCSISGARAPAAPGIWAAPLGLKSKLWIMRTLVEECDAAPAIRLENPDGSCIATDCRMLNCQAGALVWGIGAKATFERCLVDNAAKMGVLVLPDAKASVPGCVFRGCNPPYEVRGGVLADAASSTALKADQPLPPPSPDGSSYVFLSAGVKEIHIPPLASRATQSTAVPVPPKRSSPKRIVPGPIAIPHEPHSAVPAAGSKPCTPRGSDASLWSPTTASPIVIAITQQQAPHNPAGHSRNPFMSDCLTPHAVYARDVLRFQF